MKFHQPHRGKDMKLGGRLLVKTKGFHGKSRSVRVDRVWGPQTQACFTLIKSQRIWACFYCFEVVDNSCGCEQEILTWGVVISILSTQVDLLHLAIPIPSKETGWNFLKVTAWRILGLWLLSCEWSLLPLPSPFRVRYISKWKITAGLSVFTEFSSDALLCSCFFFLSYLCSFSIIFLMLLPWKGWILLRLDLDNSVGAHTWLTMIHDYMYEAVAIVGTHNYDSFSTCMKM